MDNRVTELLIIMACIVGIIAGGFYIVEHSPSVNCFNWFGLAKGCVVTAK